MHTYLPPQVGEPENCPYLDEQSAQMEFFFAKGLNEKEFETYLAKGWRKFGLFFFRPKCPNCKACIPIRIDVQNFSPSKGQRRVLKRNEDLRVEFTPLQYREEIYQMYVKHSRVRFKQTPEQIGDRDQFLETHFIQSVPSLMSWFYQGEQLLAVGFLDKGESGLSSVYFIFDPDFDQRSLGTYGALMEIEYTKKLGLPYYYLGYFVEENKSMTYKNSFRPHEFYDWDEETWSTPESLPPSNPEKPE